MERILQALDADGVRLEGDQPVEIFIAPMGSQAFEQAFELARDLRHTYHVWLEFDDRKIDRQLRTASRLGVRFAIIIGSEEISKETVKIKDMTKGEQYEVERSAVLAWLEKHREGSDFE
ncbi:MAG TPA: hypothetical protein ENI46_02875 [Firmicutes bacterium]|nr:hypothetical protein [Bacillota bacterium]